MKPTGNKLIDEGEHPIIIGSDESGYGSMAGPLCVAAVGLPRGFDDPEVKDSKQRTEAQREALYEKYMGDYVSWVEVVEAEAIDRMGVYSALLYAHRTCLQNVLKYQKADDRYVFNPLVVVDGNLPVEQFGLGDVPAVALPKADDLVPACSMASIFAKVTRDRIMVEMDAKFPGYGLAEHKGYVTPEHKAALKKLGACPIHRQSYAPVAEVVAQLDGEEPQEAWMFDE